MDINEIGDIVFEGQEMGQLQGFSFYSGGLGSDPDQKSSKEGLSKDQIIKFETLLKEEITSRVKSLVSAEEPPLKIDTELGLTKPRIALNGTPIALLQKGERYLLPKIKLLANSLLHGGEEEAVLQKLTNWMDVYITKIAPSLAALEIELNGQGPKLIEGETPPAPLTGMARGIAFRLLEHQGILPRYLVEEDLRGVDQEARKGLWRFRIKIGASTLFVPNLLKPASTELRLSLWALENNIEKLPEVPTPGMVWCEMDKAAPSGFYRIAGFRKAGDKAIRVDMMERLADAVRDLGNKGLEFDVTPEIMGLVGLSGNDFASVMNAIGYKSRKKEIPAPQTKPDEMPVVKTVEKEEEKEEEKEGPKPVVKPEVSENLEPSKTSKEPEVSKVSEVSEGPDVPETIEKDFFTWVGQQQNSKPQGQNRNGPKKGGKPFNKFGSGKGKTPQKFAKKPSRKVEADIPDSNPFAALKTLKASMEKASKPKPAPKKAKVKKVEKPKETKAPTEKTSKAPDDPDDKALKVKKEVTPKTKGTKTQPPSK